MFDSSPADRKAERPVILITGRFCVTGSTIETARRAGPTRGDTRKRLSCTARRAHRKGALVRKRKARCAICGRRTSVSRSGNLHPHNHPGWQKPCEGTTPAPDAEAPPVPDGQAPLFAEPS